MIWGMRVQKSCTATLIGSIDILSSPGDLWFFNQGMMDIVFVTATFATLLLFEHL